MVMRGVLLSVGGRGGVSAGARDRAAHRRAAAAAAGRSRRQGDRRVQHPRVVDPVPARHGVVAVTESAGGPASASSKAQRPAAQTALAHAPPPPPPQMQPQQIEPARRGRRSIWMHLDNERGARQRGFCAIEAQGRGGVSSIEDSGEREREREGERGGGGGGRVRVCVFPSPCGSSLVCVCARVCVCVCVCVCVYD
jgi:hypothetical protein